MLQSLRKKKLFLFCAFLILGALALTFVHHHEGHASGNDCAICHFVAHIAAFCLALIAFIDILRTSHRHAVPAEKVISLLRSANLLGRAPPLGF